MDDPYSILGVYPDCSYEEAKAAYRKAALLHHPDRHPPARKAEAERRFRILAHAFQRVSRDLGHPVNGGKPPNSNPPTPTAKSSPANNSSLVKKTLSEVKTTPSEVKTIPSGKPSAQRSVSQPSQSQKSITDRSEPPKKLENHHHQDRSDRSIKNSPVKTVQSDEPHHDSPPHDPLDDFAEFNPDCSGPNSSILGNDESDEYPSTRSATRPHPDDYPSRHHPDGHPSRHSTTRPYRDDYPSRHSDPRLLPPLSRRSSFSHPSERASKNRVLANDYDYSLGPEHLPQHKYSDREQLYSLPQNGRDKDWDFGLGGDDFFNSGMDRFGSASAMMNGIGSGFDRMMSSAFQGLSMAGPDPHELARMQDGDSCSMRMRQSKMVMGRTEDGSWAGKKMEKQMNMANGKLEVSENAQDIRMGGGPAAGRSQHHPPRNGNMRRGPDDWDPPPAYQGGENHYYEQDGYEPQVGIGPVPNMVPGMSPYGDMIPGPARRGSVSRSSRSNLASAAGYYDPAGPQRRPTSRFDYGPELGHPSSSMGRHDMLLGHPPMNRSLARRASGEVSARY